MKGFGDLGNKTQKHITRWMVLSTFFSSITQLLGYENRNVQRKTLVLLCETLREEDPNRKKQKESRKSKHRRAISLFQINPSASNSSSELCLKLVEMINSTDCDSNYSKIRVASISSIEVLASRSLFVPYFKYLLESCVRHLSAEEGADLSGLKRKKKNAKISDMKNEEENDLVLAQKHWHLRTLIVKTLHKCFLYDVDRKILDSSNFEILLKPIVAQFVLEPLLFSLSDVPTVEEMDESLVLCLGQMAVTARSNVLWKPLNHEVLMQREMRRYGQRY